MKKMRKKNRNLAGISGDKKLNKGSSELYGSSDPFSCNKNEGKNYLEDFLLLFLWAVWVPSSFLNSVWTIFIISFTS